MAESDLNKIRNKFKSIIVQYKAYDNSNKVLALVNRFGSIKIDSKILKQTHAIVNNSIDEKMTLQQSFRNLCLGLDFIENVKFIVEHLNKDEFGQLEMYDLVINHLESCLSVEDLNKYRYPGISFGWWEVRSKPN